MVLRSVRLLRKGDIVDVESGEQVVRSVDVVINLANGESVSFASSEEVEILEKESLSELEQDLQTLSNEDESDNMIPVPPDPPRNSVSIDEQSEETND